MISFDQVTKRYQAGAEPALEDISVEIERGEFAFLIGASGSGKSTMMKLVTRQVAATRGTVMVAGRDLRTLPDRKVPALRRDIGVVFQDFRLLENKTVHQNVAFALQVLGVKRRKIRQLVAESLELVGLDGKARRRPHELSGGEQQRVAIARAMVKQPQLLLADEPTGNLDPETSDEIVKVLQRINKTGTTLLVATHDQRIVDDFRQRVIELSHGQLVRDESGGAYLRERRGRGEG
ncbi:cell division ATP-binding protein FtsE [Calidifontibacter sp. DB0510]|uniref:Cell division ATP-binding protein FtsE n=1 Tax=Metallococcus carri TaxID=1656884 RepID=A0A967EFA1_9MICO|nr:cell division ATP-binding protein FtsE [Metallococcus carri]NHN56446.1 cell division ATP-binding protein FtsE [Metallococcus carri]NOP36070.1 cell division ATP-binding protein FtsE [Calidifontibacter sp. DB2511S]